MSAIHATIRCKNIFNKMFTTKEKENGINRFLSLKNLAIKELASARVNTPSDHKIKGASKVDTSELV